MEQLESGVVASVAEVAAGDELVTAVAAGATTLVLGDAVDFTEDGGTLAIGEELLAYSSADLDTDTLLLTDPTTAAYEVGEPVLVYPPAPERVAVVRLDEDGEAVDARVPHALYDRIPEGIREADLGERVSLTLDGAAWVVADVLGKEPNIDGTFVDLDDVVLPGGTDGLPPATSPTPTVLGGVGVLHVRWTGIANADPVTYDVHLSTSDGFTPDGTTTLAAQTPGTAITLRALPDGTPLAYGTTYYVRLIATDPDPGAAPASTQGSAQLHEVSNEEISALFAYLGTVSADQITAGDVDASVVVSGEFKTADSGRRVVLDALGLHLFSSADVPLVDLPTDTSKSATFTGDADMQNLTVGGGLSLEAPGEIATNAGLELNSGLTAPATGPTITLDHEVGTGYGLHAPAGATTGTVRQVAYHGAYAYAAVETGAGSEIQRFPRDGGDYDTAVAFPAGTLARGVATDAATGNVWALAWVTASSRARVYVYDASLTYSGTSYDLPLPGAGVGSNHCFGLDVDSGTVYVGAYRVSGGNNLPLTYRLPTTGGAWTTHNIATAFSASVLVGDLRGFAAGVFDYGDGIVRVAFNQLGTVYMWRADTGGILANEFATGSDLGIGGTDPVGWDRTGSTFRQVASIVDLVQPEPRLALWKRFSSIRLVGSTKQWWASHTWRDSDAAGPGGTNQTDQSKRTGFTMRSRYRLRLDAPAIPDAGGSDDPNSVSFYVGAGATDPGRTAMWLQGGTLAPGVTTLTLTSVLTSGTNPPATNDFPSGTPGYVRSAAKRADGTPKINLNGLGAANVDGLLPPGSVTMWAGGTTPPTGWALCNGQALNTATSPDLFAAIGYTYGGSGTSFNVPDFNDRMPLGAGGARAAGAEGGSETTVIAVTNMPPHGHNMDHNHTAAARSTGPGSNPDRLTAASGASNALSSTSPNAFNGNTGLGAGDSTPLDVLNPFLAIRFIIKL